MKVRRMALRFCPGESPGSFPAFPRVEAVGFRVDVTIRFSLSVWRTSDRCAFSRPVIPVQAVTSVAAKGYQLQGRSSLNSGGGWSNVTARPVTALGGPLILSDPNGLLQTQVFYRVAVTP